MQYVYDLRCGGAGVGAGTLAKAVESVVGVDFPRGTCGAGRNGSGIGYSGGSGLTVSNLQNCGYIQWYDPVKQSQYFVFLFKTSTYTGDLKGSAEGKVKWMTLDEMLSGKLAPNMKQYLAVFQNEDIPQAFGIAGQGLKLVDNCGILL